MTKYGHSAIVETTGNQDCHIILRGGKIPNYSSDDVAKICDELDRSNLRKKLMIDFPSHANSSKDYKRQMLVAEDG